MHTKYRHRKRLGINAKDKVELVPCSLAAVELGRFSEWSGWSQCSASGCDMGESKRHRHCLGRTCVGQMFESRDCGGDCKRKSDVPTLAERIAESITQATRGVKMNSVHPSNALFEYSYAIGNFSFVQARDVCADTHYSSLAFSESFEADVLRHTHDEDKTKITYVANIVREVLHGRESGHAGSTSGKHDRKNSGTVNFWTGKQNSEKRCEVLSFAPKTTYHINLHSGTNSSSTSLVSETKYINCNKDFANIVCVKPSLEAWTEWSECTKTCDGGYQYRTQQCGLHAPSSCQMRFDSRDCNVQPCDRDCHENKKLDCYEADCNRSSIKHKCPITCKVKKCEKYWTAPELEFFDRK